ncbi:glucose-1-phosphate thymidylyltransferase [Sphaerisporangium perillae]|uniref:glucose-1-phosphate thymidylyltransferase n=1 Tax=Sphaerisporangium perillae TaxID=2935860 RepID=UPI002010AF21|nr:glucose-1-phosphate thymidylyltransferase [Sphaerisporangium perillae]
MKALVLAGGRGTRLRPITNTSAKQLVPIANKPVLFYGLEALREAGVREAGVIVGDTAAEVRAAVGDGSRFGLRVTYIPQEAPLGLAHCVLIARDFLGDDDFVVYLGDNFIVNGIAGFVETFRVSRPDVDILLTKVPDPSNFGVAELDTAGRVVGVAEKPAHPVSDLAIVGVYLCTPRMHEAVRAIEPSARGELEITDALRWLIDRGADVRSHVISGYWKDTGRVEDMLECNRMVLETVAHRVSGRVCAGTRVSGRVVVEEGAEVSGSHLVGPLVIGAGTRVRDSYVGPFTSIGANCELSHTEIEYSIVMERSVIRGVRRIQDSLVGKDVTVALAECAPKAHRLVLGDHSLVRLDR